MKIALAATVLLVTLPMQSLLAEPCSPRWLPDESKVGINGNVRTMARSGDGQTLYAGGSFSSIGGTAALNVARFDGRSWHAMSDGLNGAVWTLAVVDLGTGPSLYAGGDFLLSGGTAVSHLARWNGTSWQAVGGGTNGGVFALVGYSVGGSTVLVAAGQFSSAGGTPVSNIATYNGTTWSALGAGVSGGFISFVRALAVFDAGTGPQLYAAGLFSSPGSNIARWNGTTWSALGTGTGGAVNAMLVWNDGTNPALYVAGYFTSAGNIAEATRIARWNGTTWSALGTGLGGEPVWALAAFDDGNGDALYAGGQFTLAGALDTARIARWRNSNWDALEGGILDDPSDPCWCDESCEECGPKPAVVYALSGYKGSLYVAGDFLQPTGSCSPAARHLARWSCKPADVVLPDWDWDRNIDANDLDHFLSCATGPLVAPIDTCCEGADFNKDNRIDMLDFAILQRCLSISPGTTPAAGCDN